MVHRIPSNMTEEQVENPRLCVYVCIIILRLFSDFCVTFFFFFFTHSLHFHSTSTSNSTHFAHQLRSLLIAGTQVIPASVPSIERKGGSAKVPIICLFIISCRGINYNQTIT